MKYLQGLYCISFARPSIHCFRFYVDTGKTWRGFKIFVLFHFDLILSLLLWQINRSKVKCGVYFYVITIFWYTKVCQKKRKIEKDKSLNPWNVIGILIQPFYVSYNVFILSGNFDVLFLFRYDNYFNMEVFTLPSFFLWFSPSPIRCKVCNPMLQCWAILAYGGRLHVLLMKKALERFGKGISLQLFIVFLILLSTSMLMIGTKMFVQMLYDVILLWLKYNLFLSLMLSILLLQLLKSIPGLETHG